MELHMEEGIKEHLRNWLRWVGSCPDRGRRPSHRIRDVNPTPRCAGMSLGHRHGDQTTPYPSVWAHNALIPCTHKRLPADVDDPTRSSCYTGERSREPCLIDLRNYQQTKTFTVSRGSMVQPQINRVSHVCVASIHRHCLAGATKNGDNDYYINYYTIQNTTLTWIEKLSACGQTQVNLAYVTKHTKK